MTKWNGLSCPAMTFFWIETRDGVKIMVPIRLADSSPVIGSWLEALKLEGKEPDDQVFQLDFDPVDVYAFLGDVLSNGFHAKQIAKKRVGDFLMMEKYKGVTWEWSMKSYGFVGKIVIKIIIYSSEIGCTKILYFLVDWFKSVYVANFGEACCAGNPLFFKKYGKGESEELLMFDSVKYAFSVRGDNLISISDELVSVKDVAEAIDVCRKKSGYDTCEKFVRDRGLGIMNEKIGGFVVGVGGFVVGMYHDVIAHLMRKKMLAVSGMMGIGMDMGEELANALERQEKIDL